MTGGGSAAAESPTDALPDEDSGLLAEEKKCMSPSTSTRTRRDAKPREIKDIVNLQKQVEHHAEKLRDLEATLGTLNLGRLGEANDKAQSGDRANRAPGQVNGTRRADSGLSAGSLPGVATYGAQGTDPYDQMWTAAKMDQMRIFDQDLLTSIYNKPYKEVRNQAAMVGSGVVGLLSMPFGPIGMAAGGMFGALFGGLIGFCADKRRRKKKIEESELEKKRLKSLIRWATTRIHEDDEVAQLLEMVTLEFKPMADIASGSKNARKQLKLLDNWVAQKSVTRQLWIYMDNLLQKWQDLSRRDFLRAMLVFQTLKTMYQHSNRMLDDQENRFVQRIERLLEHGSVQSVMAHALQFPTEGESRVMECMVYADHARMTTRLVANAGRRPDDLGVVTSPGAHDEAADLEEASDESDLEDVGSQCPSHDSAPARFVSEGEDKNLGEVKVLKKPFFRSWQDFMDFNTEIKHKMPITHSEFSLLLEKEKESTNGWDVCVDRKEIRVAKIQVGTSGVITLRAWATVPNVRLDVAFYLFHYFEERVKWDKVFANMAIIGDGCCGSDILYSLMRVPGATSRDFLQYRRVRVQEDGSIAIALRSAEHPDMPEVKGVIRAESYSSGYVLRQTFENGEPVLHMFIMSCSDIKGLIPKWVINFVAPKKPAEWMDALKKACSTYQEAMKDDPNTARVLEQYIERFKGENPYDYEVAAEDAAAHPAGEAAVPAGASASTDLRRTSTDTTTKRTKYTL